jgi:rubrerythrin
MSRTVECLREAITGEFNAATHYSKYAEIATAENFPNVAYLFRALAMAEGIHVKNHQQALGEKFQPPVKEIKRGNTRDNIQTGVEVELWEYTTMYPGLIKKVKKESDTEMAKLALLSMEWAKNVENVHNGVLKQALQEIQSGKDANIAEIWVCKVCGNLEINQKPTGMCLVCKHDPMFFELGER